MMAWGSTGTEVKHGLSLALVGLCMALTTWLYFQKPLPQPAKFDNRPVCMNLGQRLELEKTLRGSGDMRPFSELTIAQQLKRCGQ
jgi:hypothetical protein